MKRVLIEISDEVFEKVYVPGTNYGGWLMTQSLVQVVDAVNVIGTVCVKCRCEDA